jgi:NAD(P)-dependent dehydrogenase (short-subunit alcohol dehydrogenase family)
MSQTNAERTYLVTGANTGIGKEIAKGFARTSATVVLACRSLDRGEAARAEIARETGNDRLKVMQVDMADTASVRAFAAAFQREHARFDALVNNAGMWQTKHETTPEGIEKIWATNVLGLLLLTQLLEDLLRKSAPARVVNVTSSLAGGLDLSDIQFERRSFDGQKAYGAAKQAVNMLTQTLSEKLSGAGVTVNAFDPGLVGGTEALRNVGGFAGAVFPVMAKLFGKKPAQAADVAVWLATAPELEKVTGKLFAGRKEKPMPEKHADPAARRALWDACEKMIAGVSREGDSAR